MKLKKMISIMAVGAASMSILAGCQASGTKAINSMTAAAQTEQSSTAEASSEDEKTADNTENTGNGSGKTLVVYYSASGNTERVAKAAAEAAGADLFEIVPVEPYTSEDLNWTNDNSRVSREHNDESLRDVELTSTEVANWDSYDTVLIGYPIWWGIAAWPTDGFVKANVRNRVRTPSEVLSHSPGSDRVHLRGPHGPSVRLRSLPTGLPGQRYRWK